MTKQKYNAGVLLYLGLIAQWSVNSIKGTASFWFDTFPMLTILTILMFIKVDPNQEAREENNE